MKKYKKFNIPLPLYSEEYKQEMRISDSGKDRTVQWLGEVLDWAMEEFDLDVVSVFTSLQELQYMCFIKNDVRMSDYMSDLIQETKSCMYSELPRKGENPKYTILTDFYIEKLTDWYDELYECDQVPEEDEPPDEVPEVPKVVKLKGAKRGQKRTEKN